MTPDHRGRAVVAAPHVMGNDWDWLGRRRTASSRWRSPMTGLSRRPRASTKRFLRHLGSHYRYGRKFCRQNIGAVHFKITKSWGRGFSDTPADRFVPDKTCKFHNHQGLENVDVEQLG